MKNNKIYLLVVLIFSTTLATRAQEQEAKKKGGEIKKVEEVTPRNSRRGTQHNINFDLGMNNYIHPNGNFPDANDELYTVKPFGSWFVGVNSMTKVNVFGPVFFEFGGGISWYNFKFQNTSVRMLKDNDRVVFYEDTNGYNNYIKSKLGITYLNIQALPGIEIKRDFRLYGGMYAGYRVGSRSKMVYDDGKRNKNIDKNNYFLSNFRYGIRAQVGIRSMDVFFNYDLNPLFEENRGPELNAFSFGIIF